MVSLYSVSLNPAQTCLCLPCSVQESLLILTHWRDTIHFYIAIYRSNSRALPWHKIIADKILITSNFLQEHRHGITLMTSAPQLDLPPLSHDDLSPAGVLTFHHIISSTAGFTPIRTSTQKLEQLDLFWVELPTSISPIIKPMKCISDFLYSLLFPHLLSWFSPNHRKLPFLLPFSLLFLTFAFLAPPPDVKLSKWRHYKIILM